MLTLSTGVVSGADTSRKQSELLALPILNETQCHGMLSKSDLTDPTATLAQVKEDPRGLVALLLGLKNPTVLLNAPRSIISAAADQLYRIDPNERGHLKIAQCSGTGCGFVCCEFDRNYILMFPGEWERAEKAGYDLSNLKVIKIDRFGGRRVQPKNKGCCSSGTNQWKSLDCASYPLFPSLQNSQRKQQFNWICGGSKCPLSGTSTAYRTVLERHLVMVERAWMAEIKRNPTVADWLSSEVEMVGYEPFVPTLE